MTADGGVDSLEIAALLPQATVISLLQVIAQPTEFRTIISVVVESSTSEAKARTASVRAVESEDVCASLQGLLYEPKTECSALRVAHHNIVQRLDHLRQHVVAPGCRAQASHDLGPPSAVIQLAWLVRFLHNLGSNH